MRSEFDKFDAVLKSAKKTHILMMFLDGANLPLVFLIRNWIVVERFTLAQLDPRRQQSAGEHSEDSLYGRRAIRSRPVPARRCRELSILTGTGGFLETHGVFRQM